MRLVSRTELDDLKWNQVVLNATCFRHYGLTYFLDACAPNWEALVWGDYEIVWPLPVKSFPVKRVFQPLLAQQLGPFSESVIDSKKINDALALIQAHFKSVNIKFNESVAELSLHQLTDHLNVEMSLSADYETLRQGYNRNVKSNLKKAEKSQVEVKRNDEAFAFVIDAFKKGERADNTILNGDFYQDVSNIYRAFLERGEAECYVALINDQPVAGQLILTTDGRILNFFTASTPAARSTGAMHAIVDFVIKQYSTKAQILDFEGSNDESLRFFYQSFGGSEKVYLQAQFNTLIWPLNKLIK